MPPREGSESSESRECEGKSTRKPRVADVHTPKVRTVLRTPEHAARRSMEAGLGPWAGCGRSSPVGPAPAAATALPALGTGSEVTCADRHASQAGTECQQRLGDYKLGIWRLWRQRRRRRHSCPRPWREPASRQAHGPPFKATHLRRGVGCPAGRLQLDEGPQAVGRQAGRLQRDEGHPAVGSLKGRLQLDEGHQKDERPPGRLPCHEDTEKLDAQKDAYSSMRDTKELDSQLDADSAMKDTEDLDGQKDAEEMDPLLDNDDAMMDTS